MIITVRVKGGPGSGHFGHIGRPGLRGGSLPGKGGGGGSGPVLKVLHMGEEIEPDRYKTHIVANMLQRHPAKVTSQLNDIVLCATEEDWKRIYRETFNDDDYESCGGFFVIDTKTMCLPPDYDVHCFDHELGHMAWYAAMPSDDVLESGTLPENGVFAWDNAYYDFRFDRHTEYSKWGGVTEAFAESYAAWVQTGGEVANVSELPEVYEHNMLHISETFSVVQEVIDAIP